MSAGRDKGRAPYLGLHPLLRLKKGAQGREREEEVTAEARTPGRGWQSAWRSAARRYKEADAGPWPWPPTALGQTLHQGYDRRFLWSSSPASFTTTKKAGKQNLLIGRSQEPGPKESKEEGAVRAQGGSCCFTKDTWERAHGSGALDTHSRHLTTEAPPIPLAQSRLRDQRKLQLSTCGHTVALELVVRPDRPQAAEAP